MKMKAKMIVRGAASAFILAASLQSVFAQVAEWPQEPTDFKGARFGSSEEEVAAALNVKPRAFSRDPVHRYRSFLRQEHVLIGDTKVSISYLISNDDRLFEVNLSFQRIDYPEMKRVFEARYGPSHKTESEPWINRLGETFPNEVSTWTGKMVRIELVERSTDRDWSEVRLVYLPVEAEMHAAADAAAKKAAKTF